MKSRVSVGVLAVSLLALGAIVFHVSSAEAGMWMINKENVSTEKLPLSISASVEIEALGEKKESHLVFLTNSGANKVSILCGSAIIASATATLESITGTVNVSSCATFINEKAESNCNPLNQPIAMGGTVKAVLHEAKLLGKKLPYAKVEGSGGVLMTFKFNEETCLFLTPSIKVTGIGWIEDCSSFFLEEGVKRCKNEFEVERATHLIQEAKGPAGELGGLKFGANPITIDGSANVTLTDALHKGQTFSGLAE